MASVCKRGDCPDTVAPRFAWPTRCNLREIHRSNRFPHRPSYGVPPITGGTYNKRGENRGGGASPSKIATGVGCETRT